MRLYIILLDFNLVICVSAATGCEKNLILLEIFSTFKEKLTQVTNG